MEPCVTEFKCKDGTSYDDRTSSEAQACSYALRGLSGVAARLFFVNDPLSSTPFTTSKTPVPLLAPIPRVPSWLHMYLARATCQAPSPPLQRTVTVMAFVNMVPADYLTLIETSLGYANTRGLDDAGPSECQPDSDYRLALEILAHWLVLVMLLDGLWWIGEIGPWELELVISGSNYAMRY